MAIIDSMTGSDPAALMAIIAGFALVGGIVALVFYIYSAITMMTIAKKTKTDNAWLAWIPFANIALLANIAKKPWWPVLLMLGFWIPILNILLMLVLLVYVIMWLYKICEIRNKPGWLAILIIIPFLGHIWFMILLGILAWAD